MHNQDHEHEHHHDHCHEHEHEHHHEHNHTGHVHTHGEGCTCSECSSDSIIKIILHEGAVSASFNAETILSEEAASAVITENMLKLAEWVKENHGIIGHIKAAVTGGAGVKMFSITKNTVSSKDNKEQLETPFNILFTAIVFNIETEMFEHRLLEIYNQFI